MQHLLFLWTSPSNGMIVNLAKQECAPACVRSHGPCVKHAPGGREAVGRLRVKTADGCKGGWTCAKHAPRRGEDSMGRVRINSRYYNPTDGRWTRRDPIGNRGGVNLYVYTKNAAYWQVDLLGIATQESLQAYWERWIEERKTQLTENQQQWARKQLARGCVGITVIELGRNPQFMNCSNSLQIAKNIQNSLIKDKSCGVKCPVIYSVHFPKLIKKISLNLIMMECLSRK